MMKLSLMSAFVQSLAENRQSAIGAKIAQQWFPEVKHATYRRASANFLLEIEVGEQVYMLRCNHIEERDPSLVRAEVDVLFALAERGIRSYMPLASINGDFVEVVSTALGDFCAILYPKIIGEQYDLEEINTDQYRLWGKQLGELHQAMLNLPESFIKQRHTWQSLLEAYEPCFMSQSEHIITEYRTLLHELRELPKNSENYGLIHYDFELDNLLWQDTDMFIIDFDDAAVMWYAADIIFALRDLFEGNEIDLTNNDFQAFITGYRQHKPISDETLAQLPLFMRLHRLVTFGRLKRSLDITEFANHEPWIEKLTARITQKYFQAIDSEIKQGKVIVH